MPAKVLADFILKCVLTGTTKERDSSILHLYLIHAILGKESGEKGGLLYSTILFDKTPKKDRKAGSHIYLTLIYGSRDNILNSRLKAGAYCFLIVAQGQEIMNFISI